MKNPVRIFASLIFIFDALACIIFLVDTVMVLETEAGEQYETKYLPRLFRLSAGWRRFTLDKKLEVGDAVVFRLVEPTKFKVSFIRTNSANEVNPPVHLPVHLLHPVNHVNRRVSNKTNNYQLIVYKRGVHQVTENCSPKSQRPKTRNTGGSILLRKGILFSNITTFEEFEAAIQDLLQNHELPYGALHDYYELCCCQNAFLHEHLFEEFNPKLNGPIIIEAMKKIILDTVGLANALRTCKLSTFLHKYAMWDHTLSTYQTLGMNVGFLHARLHHLRSFAVKAEAEKSRYKEACNERGFTEGEVRKLDVILAKLRELKAIASAKLNPLVFAVEAEIKDLEVLLAKFEKFFGQYDAHIDALKLEAKNCELKFKEEASTSWFTLT
ncbi:hypothetical protein RDABS01_004905 [Bienertia sinuspersici]